jgi:ankyrin repeat protein
MKRLMLVSCLLLAACGSPSPPTAAVAAAPEDARRAEAEAELKTYYFEAARQGDVVLLREYVQSGFPVDVRTPQGYTALILAAYHGQEAAVLELIALGADACARDNRGSTATMGAAFKGELTVAKLLLDQPCAKADDRNSEGQTAAMYAALSGNTRLLDLLRQRGANLAVRDAQGRSAASIAHEQGADALARSIEPAAPAAR